MMKRSGKALTGSNHISVNGRRASKLPQGKDHRLHAVVEGRQIRHCCERILTGSPEVLGMGVHSGWGVPENDEDIA
jgi:hypothetical protein